MGLKVGKSHGNSSTHTDTLAGVLGCIALLGILGILGIALVLVHLALFIQRRACGGVNILCCIGRYGNTAFGDNHIATLEICRIHVFCLVMVIANNCCRSAVHHRDGHGTGHTHLGCAHTGHSRGGDLGTDKVGLFVGTKESGKCHHSGILYSIALCRILQFFQLALNGFLPGVQLALSCLLPGVGVHHFLHLGNDLFLLFAELSNQFFPAGLKTLQHIVQREEVLQILRVIQSIDNNAENGFAQGSDFFHCELIGNFFAFGILFAFSAFFVFGIFFAFSAFFVFGIFFAFAAFSFFAFGTLVVFRGLGILGFLRNTHGLPDATGDTVHDHLCLFIHDAFIDGTFKDFNQLFLDGILHTIELFHQHFKGCFDFILEAALHAFLQLPDFINEIRHGFLDLIDQVRNAVNIQSLFQQTLQQFLQGLFFSFGFFGFVDLSHHSETAAGNAVCGCIRHIFISNSIDGHCHTHAGGGMGCGCIGRNDAIGVVFCNDFDIAFCSDTFAIAKRSMDNVTLNVQCHGCCHLNTAVIGLGLLTGIQRCEHIHRVHVSGFACISQCTGCFGILVYNFIGFALLVIAAFFVGIRIGRSFWGRLLFVAALFLVLGSCAVSAGLALRVDAADRVGIDTDIAIGTHIAAHIGLCAVLHHIDDEAAANAHTGAECGCIGCDVTFDGVVRQNGEVFRKCQVAALCIACIGFHVHTGDVQCQYGNNRLAACCASLGQHGFGAGELGADVHAAQNGVLHADFCFVCNGSQNIDTGNAYGDAGTHTVLTACIFRELGISQSIGNGTDGAGLNLGCHQDITVVSQRNAAAVDLGCVQSIHHVNGQRARQTKVGCGKACTGNHAGVHILGLGAHFQSAGADIAGIHICCIFIGGHAHSQTNTQCCLDFGLLLLIFIFALCNGGTVCQGSDSHGAIGMDAEAVTGLNRIIGYDHCAVFAVCVGYGQCTHQLAGAGIFLTVGGAGGTVVNKICNALAVGLAIGFAGELICQGVDGIGPLFIFLGFGIAVLLILGLGILHLTQKAVFADQTVDEILQSHGIAMIAGIGGCFIYNIGSCPCIQLQSLACQNLCRFPDGGQNLLIHNGNGKEAAGRTGIFLSHMTAGSAAQLDCTVCIDQNIAGICGKLAVALHIHVCLVIHNGSGQGQRQQTGACLGGQADTGVRSQIDTADIGFNNRVFTDGDASFADHNAHCQGQAKACQSGVACVGIHFRCCKNPYCAGIDAAKDIGNGAADLYGYKVQVGCLIPLFQFFRLLILGQRIVAGDQTFQSGKQTLGLNAGDCDFHSLCSFEYCICCDSYNGIADNIKEACGNFQTFILQVVFQNAEAMAVRILQIQQNAVGCHIAIDGDAACLVQGAGLGAEKHIDIGDIQRAHRQFFSLDDQIAQEAAFAGGIGEGSGTVIIRKDVVGEGFKCLLFHLFHGQFHFPLAFQSICDRINILQGNSQACIQFTDGCSTQDLDLGFGIQDNAVIVTGNMVLSGCLIILDQFAGQMQPVQFTVAGALFRVVLAVKADLHAAEAGEADGGVHIQHIISLAAVDGNGGTGKGVFFRQFACRRVDQIDYGLQHCHAEAVQFHAAFQRHRIAAVAGIDGNLTGGQVHFDGDVAAGIFFLFAIPIFTLIPFFCCGGRCIGFLFFGCLLFVFRKIDLRAIDHPQGQGIVTVAGIYRDLQRSGLLFSLFAVIFFALFLIFWLIAQNELVDGLVDAVVDGLPDFFLYLFCLALYLSDKVVHGQFPGVDGRRTGLGNFQFDGIIAVSGIDSDGFTDILQTDGYIISLRCSIVCKAVSTFYLDFIACQVFQRIILFLLVFRLL